MSVDCELEEASFIRELYDVEPASNDDIKKLEIYISNAKPDTELTMSAGTLKSLLKRIKPTKE